jgi:hypothetical protein
MQNHKHAVVMAPDLAFEVLQSTEGDALFFSIGTDHVLYLTREVTATPTGWNRVDLSSALAAEHGGATVVAKTFAVSQDAQSLGVDIALVVTVGGTDFLYLSLGNVNTDATWADGVTWTAVPFDAGSTPNPLTIADVALENLPVPGGGAGSFDNIFVDVVRTPGDPLRLLNRYYITPGGSPWWHAHHLAADLAAGSVVNCLGQRVNDPLPGIYTFGSIDGERELLFTPQYNYFRPSVAPSPARLTLPAGASGIASALTASGVSNLFVAAADGLYVFTADNQHDRATPVRVVASTLVAGATTLAAASDATRTSVWSLGPQGSLCYTTCPAGSEADPAAWSAPVPLLPTVAGFAFFLNSGAGNHVLFAHVAGEQVACLVQDPVTTDWRRRDILLPATDPNDVIAYNSYTTHVAVTDDDGRAAPNAALAVTATSPVSVYLNGVYHVLSPTVAVSTTADETGVLTVVQETQSVAAVCFRVQLTDTPAVVADVNPMGKALATLGTVQSGQNLRDVAVTNGDGTTRPLVPTTVATADTDAVAQSLTQFLKINGGLPADGSRQAPTAAAATAHAAAAAPPTWGMSFTGNQITYHEGVDAVRRIGTATAAAPTPRDIGADISMAAGDFFTWVRNTVADVEHFVVREAEGVYHFLATIAGQVYDVLLDCVAAVVHAVEFVFDKIEVFFEDLIKWLGFLFVWPDIVRTHQVMKNIVRQYLGQCVDGLGDSTARLRTAFTDVTKYVDGWAGIAGTLPPSLAGTTQGGTVATAGATPGQGSPQSNWALSHLKTTMVDGSTSAQPGPGVAGDVLAVVQPLIDALGREQTVLQGTFDSFKSDVIDKIDQLSLDQIIEAVVAIIADALLASVENVLLAAVGVLAALVEGVLDVLDASIDIPVLSWAYQQATGDQLSLLDAVCLVAAIPVTVGYKIIAGSTPFPDDATTTALIAAPDFATIQKICTQGNAVARVAPAVEEIPASVTNILGLTGGIASAVGAVVLSVSGPLAKKFPQSKLPPIISGLAYPLYVLPGIVGQIPDLQKTKWWAITNQVISDLMLVKSLVDLGVALTAEGSAAQGAWSPVTPWLDFGGNILWQVPTTAALFDKENQNTAGILNFWGGTCFDCNGVMSPVLADDEDPITWGVAVGVAAVFNLAYGSMSCAASALPYNS